MFMARVLISTLGNAVPKSSEFQGAHRVRDFYGANTEVICFFCWLVAQWKGSESVEQESPETS